MSAGGSPGEGGPVLPAKGRVGSSNAAAPSRTSSVATFTHLQHRNGGYQSIPNQAQAMIQILKIDDDLTITIIGRKTSSTRNLIFLISCWLSLGIIYLISRWSLSFEMKMKTSSCCLKEANIIAVINQYDELTLLTLKQVEFNDKLGIAFPKSEEKERNLDFLFFFEYRYFRFLLNPVSGMFEPNYAWVDPAWVSVESVISQPASHSSIPSRQAIFGSNEIEIQQKSNTQILIDEVVHPFFVFQIASIILWSLDSYYQYATCILLITVASTVATFFETKNSMQKMRNLSRFKCSINLWRNGAWVISSSDQLVPGDLFQVDLEHTSIVPCDAVLLFGDCIVNESMLTGESLPVSKTPITNKDFESLDFDLYEPSSSAKLSSFFLFSGTKVIRARGINNSNLVQKVWLKKNAHDSSAIAMVVRTGFNSAKGNLIRAMLYPRPNTFKFYQDAFKFIGVLALISMLGFLFSLYNFILMRVHWTIIIVRALDLITIAVPPALPATMAIGTNFAIRRLRKTNIFCTSPPRVNICGKINIMLWDKTGTLTQEGLDVLGVRFAVAKSRVDETPFDEPQAGPIRFSRIYSSIDSLMPIPLASAPNLGDVLAGSLFQIKSPHNPNYNPDFPYPLMVCALAACHSIKVVCDVPIGDPLELKMFHFTKWELEEDIIIPHPKPHGLPTLFSVRPPWVPSFDSVAQNGAPNDSFCELCVLKSFEFTSILRRMSVILLKSNYAAPIMTKSTARGKIDPSLTIHDYEVFVKGAPEMISSICMPESLPEDFLAQLDSYTHHGYRVLAVGWRRITNISYSEMKKIKRSQVESQLRFLGFIIFENKLKSGTAPVVDTLNKAAIRQVMCTGDNILTAISVSRECGIFTKSTMVFVPKFVSGEAYEQDAQLIWEDADGSGAVVDFTTFKVTGAEDTKYELAITGDAFQYMLDYSTDEAFERMLIKCQVFARMSPDQKHFLVENLQQIGYCVGFCGDGTNDCGALKSADIGISLSAAEASIAAPFTSRSTDLDCVLRCIREGRVALVTSFSCFKYMALYSLIQFTSVSLMYLASQNLGDTQFMYVDLCIIIPTAVLMGRASPHSNIHRKRPTASLVSNRVLCSMISQVLLCMFFQIFIFVWVRNQSFYSPGKIDIETETYLSFENTLVFLVSCFQYIIIAVVFSVGPPYQEPIWKNVPLVIMIVFLVALTSLITLIGIPFLENALELVPLPWIARETVMYVAVMNFVFCWLTEKYVNPLLVMAIGAIRDRWILLQIEPGNFSDMNYPPARVAKLWKWRRSGKVFKIVLDYFR